MPRFGQHHYVPILTWKMAEQQALQTLPDHKKSALTPLLAMVPIPTDRKTGNPTKTPDEHIDHSIDKLVSSWGQSSEFFLDPRALRLEVTDSGEDGTARTFSRGSAQGLSFVPVTGPYRTEFEIASALLYRQRGVCIRMSILDFDRPSVISDLSHFVERCEVGLGNIDLILDFEGVASTSKFALSSSVSALLRSLPRITEWRTLTLASCAFPNLAGVQGSKKFPRTDWIVWRDLACSDAKIARIPTFGDYAIQSPRSADIYEYLNPHFTPAIRYSTSESFLVVRGISRKRKPVVEQYPELAEQLTASAEFYGSAHCDGCMDAKSCALGQPGLGASWIWRRIGTIHHLTVVIDQMTEQIASLA